MYTITLKWYRANALLAALYLVCGDFAAVNGRFPVEGNPAYTFAWRIPLPSLRSS
jgi:hypothetical protein